VWDKGGGLIKGAVAGVLFGLAIAGFAEWQRRRFTSENPCAPGEQLLKQGAANQFRGWEAVGGWLYLTDRRLLFRPHRYNVQKQGLEVPLTDIVETQVCATVWVIPNGLRVVTSQGAQRFVVEGRRSWVEAILQAREALPLA
jgi:hypothetical protein